MPFGLDEWLAIVRGDRELALQANGRDATYIDPSFPDEPRGFFLTPNGVQIYTKLPTEASLEKLCRIADQLGSCTVDVEGEVVYESV